MSKPEKAGFWIQWVFLSLIGWFVGFVLGGQWIGGHIGVGLAQWFTMRDRFLEVNQWLVLTAAGAVAGRLASRFVVETLTAGTGPEFALLASTCNSSVIALVVGSLQWFFLRRWLDHAGWWVVATIIGWSIGPFIELRILWYGPIAAAVTGAVLLWLWKERQPDERVLGRDEETSTAS